MIRIDRLKSVTKSVTKCQITLALKDEVLLNKIQLMSRIDALYEFTFFQQAGVLSDITTLRAPLAARLVMIIHRFSTMAPKQAV